MLKANISRAPADIACAFGSSLEEISKGFCQSRLVFASVHVTPREAGEIVAGMDPALSFDMNANGISLDHAGWMAAPGFFKRLNGRYIVTASDDGDAMSSFPWAHDCLAQHVRAWGQRLGDVRVTCERDRTFDYFDLHDDDHLDGNEWYSAFRRGHCTPNIIEPFEEASIDESASVKLAHIVARAATLFLWAAWGPRNMIAAHELTYDFGTLAGRFPVLSADLCRTASLQLQERIEERQRAQTL